MSFTELIFGLFFVFTYFGFFLLRRRATIQIAWLLFASYLFYGWWKVGFLWLIVLSSVLDFAVGHLIARSSRLFEKKIYLSLSLLGNLGLLAYFKYANFFIQSFAEGMSALGMPISLSTLQIVLPVGISFYTFQSLSYSLDIYSGKLKPEKSFLRFLFFVAAFPQLVAGPIVRAREFLPQLHNNLFQKSDDSGLFYILYGLFKKIVIADLLAFYIVDRVFASPTSFSGGELWLAMYAYAFQIFFDFSAYSDIAIGLGRIFGLRLPINFLSPYVSVSPSEFWRRWHITLSSWLRDYLYIPLGGNRKGFRRQLFNLMLVMTLGGLWHGANWTFVIWGALHGLYLIVYRVGEKIVKIQFPPLIKRLLFFHLVCFAWIFFRCENMTMVLDYFRGIYKAGSFISVLSMGSIILLLVAWFFHDYLEPRLESMARSFQEQPWWCQGLQTYAFFIVIALLNKLGVSHQAFIYFQF